MQKLLRQSTRVARSMKDSCLRHGDLRIFGFNPKFCANHNRCQERGFTPFAQAFTSTTVSLPEDHAPDVEGHGRVAAEAPTPNFHEQAGAPWMMEET
jgi:hypothetical protein